MSSTSEWVGGVLAICGCAVAVLASLAMYAVRGNDDRLHLLAPVTTVAGPLIAAGLIAYDGLNLTSLQVAVIAIVLAMTGPSITTAVARAATERSRPEETEEPE